jgi:hypothetical protein
VQIKKQEETQLTILRISSALFSSTPPLILPAYDDYEIISFGNLATHQRKIRKKRLQREILNPLEPSLDHLGATLFHRFLQMGKG